MLQRYNVQTDGSPEALNFVLGMLSIEKRWEKSRELFQDFIESKGIKAFHIHDGWVRHKHQNGSDVLKHDLINLTWIANHAGYSHSSNIQRPKNKENIVIVEDSPDIERDVKGITMRLYKVVDKRGYGFGSIVYELKWLDTFPVIFDGNKYTYCK